jgi:hypothetical protein
MNNAIRIIVGLVVIAHGIVHPILATVPDAEIDAAPVGSFWNKSWLLGETLFVKNAIYTLSGLAALLLLLAGLSLMGVFVPAEWWQVLWVAGAAASGFLLIFFWHPWFFLGLVIDAVMIGLLFVSGFSPA